MNDSYPDTLEFEIDRDALRRYLRVKWFLSWVGGLAFFGGMIGFGSVTGRLDNHDYSGILDLLALLATGIGRGLAGAFILSAILYLLLSHRLAAVEAASLRVIVEGAFLRIVQHGYVRMDRKLHFRSIVDYTTLEGPLMRRFGIMALHMTTTGGGNQAGLQIFGIRACPDARDKLAEIDALRENG
jgi:membrane protein YdbS with pleckstrin-like domain